MGSEITRHLASIQIIKDINPIPDADSIEVARVMGWDVVVKKNEFNVGDKVIYFEIDSFLPKNPIWEFLEKNCLRKMGDKEGLRIKTVKLRGQISQGLILPLNVLEDFGIDSTNLEEGYDLTQQLNIDKYEPPIPACLSGIMKGNFPSFIPKTDQARIQGIFYRNKDKLMENKYEVTIKLDGTSCTIYYNKNDDEFGVCSRNMNLVKTDDNTYWKIAIQYELENKLRILDRSLAIQGEIIGESIQGNREKIKGQDLYVFDIFDIDTQKYLSAKERYQLTEQLGIKHIPVLDNEFSLWGLTLDDILKMSNGKSINNPIREGLVFKSLDNPDFSFKVISNEFLLKEK